MRIVVKIRIKPWGLWREDWLKHNSPEGKRYNSAKYVMRCDLIKCDVWCVMSLAKHLHDKERDSAGCDWLTDGAIKVSEINNNSPPAASWPTQSTDGGGSQQVAMTFLSSAILPGSSGASTDVEQILILSGYYVYTITCGDKDFIEISLLPSWKFILTYNAKKCYFSWILHMRALSRINIFDGTLFFLSNIVFEYLTCN